MLFTTALSFGALLTSASANPVQARDGHLAPRAYKDVSQVLDRIIITVTTIANHVSSWPGNPKRTNTFDQIVGFVPTLQQDCVNLLSDLSVGTDWIQQNKKTTLGVVDAASLIPRLAALNNAVSTYTNALLDKRAWADTSSSTPALYEQLLLQKQWATALSTAITQSLSISTSWLGGPITDFFFGSHLDEAIKAYADGAKYRPGPAPGQTQPSQQNGPQWGTLQSGAPPYNPQQAPYPQQGQNAPNQYQSQNAPPYQGPGGWNGNVPTNSPTVQEAPDPVFESNPPTSNRAVEVAVAEENVYAPLAR